MTRVTTIAGITCALALGFGAVTPSHAEITAQLARQCRDMMIKAHPTEVFGSGGSAAAQRAYFADCVRRNGDMPRTADEKNGQPNPPQAPSTTGQGPSKE